MAFRDITKEIYGGKVRLEYKDKAHRYYAYIRQPDGSWGKAVRPSSVTTVKDDTLEKKGLLTWPMGLAMRHLTGFYSFTNEDGKKMTGFSQGIGVLWEMASDTLLPLSREDTLQHCIDAVKMWQDRQKAGADIGTLVHSTVEEYITSDGPVVGEITISQYRDKVTEKEGIEAITKEWEERAPGEVILANNAYESFVSWWEGLGATVLMSEEILYSLENNIAGTMDYLLNIPEKGLVLADLKTTKASVSAGAPMGVYYDNFVQLGMYAMMLDEMGYGLPDDMMIISARKDGGFDHVYASELGKTVQDCIGWARSVIHCNRMMKETKAALKELAGPVEKREPKIPVDPFLGGWESLTSN